MPRILLFCLMLPALISCSPARSTAPRLGRLAGSIFEADGLPAHGALVSATYLADPYTPVLLASTDANGQFDFGEVIAGDWVVLTNHGVAWAAAETLFAPSTTSRLRLMKAGAIRGRARLQGAASAPNIIISALFPEALDESDTAGAFLVGGVAPGQWRVFFSHAAYRDTSAAFAIPAVGDTTTVPDIVLVPLAPLRYTGAGGASSRNQR